MTHRLKIPETMEAYIYLAERLDGTAIDWHIEIIGEQGRSTLHADYFTTEQGAYIRKVALESFKVMGGADA